MAPSEISRREILAGIGGIGVAGAVSGAGTYALFSAEESFGGSIRSGTLSIDIDCDRCIVDDNGVSLALGGIDRGDSGTETLVFTVETNPARLWIGSDCPPAVDPLGDVLLVTLRYDGVTVESGTLSSVRRSLRSGLLLGEECTTPGETVELDIGWELPFDAPDATANKQTNFEFVFVGNQCRHTDSTGGDNPFAGTPPCDEPPECVSCPRDGDYERIASATFEYDGPGGAVVELIRGGNGTGSGDVLAAETVDPGDSFTAVLHDPPVVRGGADIDVDVDGTTINDFHISCSELFGPGLVIGDGTYSLTVLEATDTEGNTLCGVANE